MAEKLGYDRCLWQRGEDTAITQLEYSVLSESQKGAAFTLGLRNATQWEADWNWSGQGDDC